MVAGKIKKILDAGKKAKNVIKMTPAEIARRKKNLWRLKKKKEASTVSSYKIDEKKGSHDTRLKDHDDYLKSMQKEMKEKEGWDQLFSKGGSVTKQRRLSKRGWGVTKRKQEEI